MALLLLLCALATRPVGGWNIGGHSPVKDLSSEPVQKATLYAITDGLKELNLPSQEEAFTVGDTACTCTSCACLLSATKQVVAGINWVLTLKVVPASSTPTYRRVTVYDKSFAGGNSDTYSVTKVDTISSSDAQVSKYTASALHSMADPEAQSDHHAADNDGKDGKDGKVIAADPAQDYMDKLGKRSNGLVQHVTFTPEGCADGLKVQTGDLVSMHYTGTLPNGQKFDSSYDRGTPFEFKIGANQVIQGWEKLVPGMCVGEKSRLYIPSAMAYGEKGFGAIIPPNSNLIFDVEVMDIKRD